MRKTVRSSNAAVVTGSLHPDEKPLRTYFLFVSHALVVHANECGEHSVPPRSPFHSPSSVPHAPNAMSPPASEKKMRHLVLDSLVFAGSTRNMLASCLSCPGFLLVRFLRVSSILFALDPFDPRLTSSHLMFPLWNP